MLNKHQLLKILKVMILATILMLFFDLLFFEGFPISKSISNWIVGFQDKYWLLWLAIWFLMFIQTTILPIPALVILNAVLQISLFPKSIDMFTSTNFWIFILVTTTAYMAGAIAAYWLGLKFGKAATKWCAGSEEDYKKWSRFLTDKGKWFYAGTVILPIFPDDLLCIVAGSVKFDFKFFLISNAIGRTIGLLAMMATLGVIGSVSSGSVFPWSSLLWGIGLILELVVYFILKKKIKEENINNE